MTAHAETQTLNDSQFAEQLRAFTEAETNEQALQRLMAVIQPPTQVIVTQYASGQIAISPVNMKEIPDHIIQGLLINAQGYVHSEVVKMQMQLKAQAQAQAAAAHKEEAVTTTEPPAEEKPQNRAARRNRRPR